MNRKKIVLEQLNPDFWIDQRRNNGVREQECFANYGYGEIIHSQVYNDFVDLFKDLGMKDEWLCSLRIEPVCDSHSPQRRLIAIKDYLRADLRQIFEDPKNSRYNELMSDLLRTEMQVSLGMSLSSNGRRCGQIHFRKYGGKVYTGSVRMSPVLMTEFTRIGFSDPKLTYLKVDYFPNKKLYLNSVHSDHWNLDNPSDEACLNLKGGLDGRLEWG